MREALTSRRPLVIAAVSVVVTIAACAEAQIVAPPEPTTGSISVSTTTSGDPGAASYSVSIGGAAGQSIGLNGSLIVADLTPGSRSVVLTGFSSNCSVAGGASRSVTVSAGATAAVSFAVTCVAPTGSIAVTTTTSGDPGTATYSISVDGGAAQSIDLNGSLTVSGLSLGSHTVVLTGFSVDCTVAGGASRTVDVTDGGTTPASFDVTCVPPFTAGTAFSHIATAGTISGNYTVFNHATTDGDPNAIMLLTQNWEPNSIYNAPTVGLWYTGANWSVFNQDLSAMPADAAFNIMVPDASMIAFVHDATAANIVGQVTIIDHPDLNGNRDLIPFVSQNWNPGGAGGIYNDHVVGIYYTGTNWAIFNQDLATMPDGASFNVVVPGDLSNSFIHDAEAANIAGNVTYLDHPDLNGNPNAIVTVSHNWNPMGQAGVYNTHELGVWYTGTQWSIFHQDLSAFVPGSSYSVMIGGGQ